MRVFKFSMTKRIDFYRSILFRGTFTLNKSQEIKGILTYPDGSTNYITGLFDELDHRLVFIELSIDSSFIPLLFIFSNSQTGILSQFNFENKTFFTDCHFNGLVSIDIQEVPKAKSMVEKVEEKFNKLASDGNINNHFLMSQGVSEYFYTDPVF